MFNGVGVAMVTPFTHTGEVDYAALEKVVNHVIDGGVDYIVALGTTAETPALSSNEKLEILHFILQSVNDRVPVVVGIGGNNTREVIDTCKAYPLDQVAGILSVVPYYNKPSQEGLYQHFRAIVSAIDKPFILYNVPSRTGTNMKPETALRLANEFKNVVAIKEANGIFTEMEDLVMGHPEHFSVLSGDDAIFLAQASLGMTGVISVAANAFPAEFTAMAHAAIEGRFEEARKIHYDLLPAMRLLFAEGNPTGVKYAMHKLGLLENTVRLPLVASSEKLERDFDRVFTEGNLG